MHPHNPDVGSCVADFRCNTFQGSLVGCQQVPVVTEYIRSVLCFTDQFNNGMNLTSSRSTGMWPKLTKSAVRHLFGGTESVKGESNRTERAATSNCRPFLPPLPIFSLFPTLARPTHSQKLLGHHHHHITGLAHLRMPNVAQSVSGLFEASTSEVDGYEIANLNDAAFNSNVALRTFIRFGTTEYLLDEGVVAGQKSMSPRCHHCQSK